MHSSIVRMTWVAAVLSLLVGCKPAAAPKLDKPYLEVRKSHVTNLTKRGPAPQKAPALHAAAGAKLIQYPSGDMKLHAYLGFPAAAPAKEPYPAVVFFHGGFALGAEDFTDCQTFLQNGFAVMAPSYRGENGNPGHFELLFGEVDDGRNAILWLAEQPNIDKNRIYAFGHSVGGGVAALLSLWDDIPVKATGSAGGLYPYSVFDEWANICPFDRNNTRERQLRLLVGNVANMKRPHHAYIGSADQAMRSIIPSATEEAKQANAPLTIETIDGDHHTSLNPAMQAFLKRIQN